MDWHLFKLIAVAGTIALTFGVWLYFFINSEKLLGLILSGIAYFAMLGMFSSGYFLVSVFDDFTLRDVAVVTVLSIVFIILIYGLTNLLEALQRGSR
jgi:hypothetical protein